MIALSSHNSKEKILSRYEVILLDLSFLGKEEKILEIYCSGARHENDYVGDRKYREGRK